MADVRRARCFDREDRANNLHSQSVGVRACAILISMHPSLLFNRYYEYLLMSGFVLGMGLGCAHKSAPPIAQSPVGRQGRPIRMTHVEIPKVVAGMLQRFALVRGLSLPSLPHTVVMGDGAFADACAEAGRATTEHDGGKSDSRRSAAANGSEAPQLKECSDGGAFVDTRHEQVVIKRSAFDDSSPGRQLEMLAHELEHLIQDHTLPPLSAAENSDQKRTLHALREGDATVAAIALELSLSGRTLQSSAAEILADINSLELKSLHDDHFFAYSLGTRFVLQLFRTGGFLAVNGAFARPPVSSAEILHVERYLEPQRLPINVATSLPLPAPFVQSVSTTRGEYRLRDILSYCVPGAVAVAVADDWEADQYTASDVSPPLRSMFRWVTAWHSERGAQRFAELATSNQGCLFRGEVSVARESRVVVLVGGLGDVANNHYATAVVSDVIALPQ
jgi:hypothetical protein